MRRVFTYAALALGIAISPMAAMPAFAKSDAVHTSWRNDTAVEGYDVVTFFSGKPQDGKAEFSASYKGADWYFFNQGNRDLFLTNPEQFAPQYGGYCAWAVSKGKLAPGRADHFHVEDGKLYMNYNARIQRRWLKGKANFIESANSRWPAILED